MTQYEKKKLLKAWIKKIPKKGKSVVFEGSKIPNKSGMRIHIYLREPDMRICTTFVDEKTYKLFPENNNLEKWFVQTPDQAEKCKQEFQGISSKSKEDYMGKGRKETVKKNAKDYDIDGIIRYLEDEWGAGIEMSEETKSIDTGNTESTKDQIKNLIQNGATQIILTGAPGTGKTRMAKEIAGSHYKLVQFHPSYDYTDFVEGLCPVEEEGKMVFRKVDGIFKEFCRKVVEEGKKDEKYFFLIDEINRADLSKVFGELMFCLETDKRGEDNAIQTQYQNLPTYDVKEKKYYGEDDSKDVFKDGFYIPKNVIIIGTMNDIDRSVESMDFALRRRFIWKEIVVNKEMLEASLTDIIKIENKEMLEASLTDIIKIENPEGVAAELAGRINDLNENQLKEKLGKHYYISQGQFANLPGNIIKTAVKAGKKVKEKGKEAEVEAIAKSLLEAVWNLRLNSLLYEYIRGEGNEENFVKSCHETLFVPSRSQEQPEENSQL